LRNERERDKAKERGRGRQGEGGREGRRGEGDAYGGVLHVGICNNLYNHAVEYSTHVLRSILLKYQQAQEASVYVLIL
jgi:hypothetical protein